jgi:hypothetical protein
MGKLKDYLPEDYSVLVGDELELPYVDPVEKLGDLSAPF